MRAVQPAGVILTGGRSSRMGVVHKALLEVQGQPLLQYVIDKLQPHVAPLLLSCQNGADEFDRFGLNRVPDLVSNFNGPLTGLYSALQYVSDRGLDNGLVLVPCDAPFMPENLVQTLVDAATGDVKPVVVVSCQGVLQPTFSLWQVHHLPVIRKAVAGQGREGLKHMLASLPHTIVEWPAAEPSPFFNVNTPADLRAAAVFIERFAGNATE
jgi:molybdopterin-guanine dinucleotide biosynthesis protein A